MSRVPRHLRWSVCVRLTMLGIGMAGCAGSTEPGTNPAPKIASVTVVEGDSLVLTVTGAGYVSTSSVVVNQRPVATRFLSASRLEARVAIGLATTFTGVVSVTNPAPGGGDSPQLPLTWTAAPAPVPTFTALSPAVAPVGTADVVVSLTGSGFMKRTTVYTVVGVGVVVLPVRVTSPTSAMVTVPAGLVANPRQYPIYVLNQGPGGGTALGATFEVRAPVP